MNKTLLKLIDKRLCEMVSEATDLKIVYDEKTRMIKINNKPAIPLDEKERDRLISLIGL